MALLRRFLKNPYTRFVKPLNRQKLLAALHTHGSTTPQGLNPIEPWLLNPPELESNSQRSIFELLKKSQALGLSHPAVDNFSQHCGGEAAFSKLLEQRGATQKLLEGSQAKAIEGFVSKVLEGSGNEEGLKIWADSVKKKRRKKMNKHKYKKLRKRLRRKTKK